MSASFTLLDHHQPTRRTKGVRSRSILVLFAIIWDVIIQFILQTLCQLGVGVSGIWYVLSKAQDKTCQEIIVTTPWYDFNQPVDSSVISFRRQNLQQLRVLVCWNEAMLVEMRENGLKV